MKLVYDVNQRPPLKKNLVYAFQQLLAIMAATLLVPDPGRRHRPVPEPARRAVRRRRGHPVLHSGGYPPQEPRVPGQLPSPSSARLAGAVRVWLPAASFVGSVFAGLVYVLIALIVKKTGSAWVNKLLPPVVIGPTVALIGLSLCGSAVNNLNNTAAGSYNLVFHSGRSGGLLHHRVRLRKGPRRA